MTEQVVQIPFVTTGFIKCANAAALQNRLQATGTGQSPHKTPPEVRPAEVRLPEARLDEPDAVETQIPEA